MITDSTFDPELFHDVYTAAGRADVRAAVESIYSNLAREIESRKPICNTSGRCCRFEEFGHRLYVTTLELATFVYGLEMLGNDQQQPWDGTGCPFQINRLCGVHTIRPFGCRIYFCDVSSTAWQQDLYERLHAQLKAMHESLGVGYRYLEWRDALHRLGLVSVAAPVPSPGTPGEG